MPRKSRESSGTGIYHVMLRGINRQNIFCDVSDYESILGIKRTLIHGVRSSGCRWGWFPFVDRLFRW